MIICLDVHIQSCLQDDTIAAANAVVTPDSIAITSKSPATDLSQLEADLLDAQTDWEARANFSRRLSRTSNLDLGLGTDAESEWEARAVWSLEPSRAVQDLALPDVPQVRQDCYI